MQFDFKFKSLQSDKANKFKLLGLFLENESLIYRWTCPHSFEQNNMVENHHRCVVDTDLTLLLHFGVAKNFWTCVFYIVVLILNHVPSQFLAYHSLYFLLYHKQPNFHF